MMANDKLTEQSLDFAVILSRFKNREERTLEAGIKNELRRTEHCDVS